MMHDGAVERSLVGFCGVAKLFPLPNAVFFPHVLARLRIFDPRYLEMIKDALAGDGLIAMASLQGSESEGPAYAAADPAPVHGIVCLGRIRDCRDGVDGEKVLLLEGLVRARIATELPIDRPYRQAIVEVLPDRSDLDQPPPPEEIGQELMKRLKASAAAAGYEDEHLPLLTERTPSLASLVDVFSYFSRLPTACKLRLLGEPDVMVRLKYLLQQQAALQSAAAAFHAPPNRKRYPAPTFSPN